MSILNAQTAEKLFRNSSEAQNFLKKLGARRHPSGNVQNQTMTEKLRELHDALITMDSGKKLAHGKALNMEEANVKEAQKDSLYNSLLDMESGKHLAKGNVSSIAAEKAYNAVLAAEKEIAANQMMQDQLGRSRA